MSATTGEKVDFLMNVTNTRNAVLAHALHFDASYISRIRSGKRGFPLKQPFIGPACAFFARRITEDYQRHALEGELGLAGPWPTGQAEATELLAVWLEGGLPFVPPVQTRPDLPCPAPATEEGDAHNAGTDADAHPRQTQSPARQYATDVSQAHLFFGDEGMREGVHAFLTDLADARYRGAILLQSDEDMSWLYEDEGFVKAWAALVGQLAEQGCTVRIVHTMTRDANEMWEGVRTWLPLYMSGSVEPFFYPRLRDGVRKRSLFVAPGRSALVSDSIQGMDGPALGVMLRDARAVEVLEREFGAYLALCRPLIHMVARRESLEFEHLVGSFSTASGHLAATESDGILVYVRDVSEALVVRLEPPQIAFHVTEPRLVAAIAEYQRNLPSGTDDRA